MFENLTRFRQPLIERIIDALEINPITRGIDIGCGIGKIANLLANRIGLTESLTALDYSYDLIKYASSNSEKANVRFVQGDINNLEFDSNAYDWIWSMDTVWPGPKEIGCPIETPDNVLRHFNRILKPGGNLYILYWTSQKFLPGYPFLEARLNISASANAPFKQSMDSSNHVMNGLKWLRSSNFVELKAKTFVGDIQGPLSESDKKALTIFFEMLWGNSSSEISEEDWYKFKEISSPDSERFILNNPDYYGYYMYTLFQGTKSKL